MLTAVATDAGFHLSLRWMLAALFGIAAVHKLSSPTAFVETLRSYRLVPGALHAVVARGLIAFECVATVTLLANHRWGSILALLLLLVYTVAILVNLLRNRRDIDCGCAGPGVRQGLSYWLVARNGLFVAAALATLGAVSARSLTPLDWFTAALALGTFLLLHFAAHQLAFVSNRFRER